MDLKAKAPVQMFTECNGFYGYSFCLQEGISTGIYIFKIFMKLHRRCK